MTDKAEPEIKWDELRPQLIKMGLELGPLIIFFIANARTDIFTATAWFMGAMVVSLVLTWLAWQLRAVGMTRLAGLLLIALGAQICLGLSNVYFHLPLPVAVGHNAGGAACCCARCGM